MVNGFFWGNAYLVYDKLLLSRPGSQVCTSLPQKYLHEFTICIQMYATQTILNSREKPLYTDLIMLGETNAIMKLRTILSYTDVKAILE